MTEIFLSYASEDREQARRLAEALVGEGRKVFWDRSILPGQRFANVIDVELAAARCVIVMWSQISVRKDWVLEEAEDGKKRGVLVPIQVDDVTLPRGFRRIQTASLIGWEGDATHSGYRRLAAALTDVLGSPLQPDAAKKRAAGDASRRSKKVAHAPQPTRGQSSRDGEVFRDHPSAPEMVVIPAGTFMMGSPENERGRDLAEGPRHRVSIPYRFALGKCPVMFEEYDRFAEDTSAGKPNDEGWGRGRRPVINMRWYDAAAYVDWLRQVTGEEYRLPTEAEWEYACRAGTTTMYAWGNEASKEMANYSAAKTTKVGAYSANKFGLYDMHGNVWEWIEDIWHENYEDAPADGSAWSEGSDQGARMVRGGSWINNPNLLRSAYRIRGGRLNPSYVDGIRVARTLL